uniref:DUF19 domain-containing protein n=1 Tax=Macrostomum lignano TaxID=282301 RepID=A0A1I8G9H8_9PLAT
TRVYNLSYGLCHQALSQRIFYERCGCYNPHLMVPRLNDKQPMLCFNVSQFRIEGVEKNLRCLDATARFFRNESNFRPLLERQCDHLKRPECDSLTWDVDSQREMYREMWSEMANPARLHFIADVLKFVLLNS